MSFWKKVGNTFKKAFDAIKNFLKKHWKLILLIIVICVAAYFAWQYFTLTAASKTTLVGASAAAGSSAISAANVGKTAGYVGATAVAPSSGVVSKIIGTVTEIGKNGAKFIADNPSIVGAVGGGIAITGLLKNKKLLLLLGCGLLLMLFLIKGGESK